MAGVRVEAGARHVEQYAHSFVSLCERIQARYRVLFEMRGATFDDDFINWLWPAQVYPGARTYSKMQRVLRLTQANADGLQYREMASLINEVVGDLLVSLMYDSFRNPVLIPPRCPARCFVHPITRESFGDTVDARLATCESLVGRELPLTSGYRAHDARILNWLHDLLDHLWLIRIPKGAVIRDTGHVNPTLAYQPTHSYRQYPPTGAHVEGFVWPAYQPLTDGGVLTTDTQPRAVWVEQKFAQRWLQLVPLPGGGTGWQLYGYDPWIGFPDSQITSMNPSHGWYYSHVSENFGNPLFRLYDQPLNRCYAGWVTYSRYWGPPAVDPTRRQYYHAEAYRSRYESTAGDMERWAEVSDIVDTLEWRIQCFHDLRAYGDITFVAETPLDRYEWTLAPGEKTSEVVTFRKRGDAFDPVEFYVSTPLPATTPYDIWYPLGTPYTGANEGIAASVMRATQEPLPDLYRDIREQLGETPAE